MTTTLYERLGGSPGITAIASDVVDNHFANPAVSARFAQSDVAAVKNSAATFFIQATGGPEVYEGADMLTVHKGMNISAVEFMAVLDDSMAALKKNEVGDQEQQEVLFALYGLRSEVVAV